MTYRCSPAPTPALNLLAATTALCLAWPAHAGRPLSVDDAGVDEVGQGHVEVWWEGQRGQPGTVYVAPAFTPIAGLELGAVLARDRNERHTLQGLQAKWLWSPAQEQGCNAGSSAGVVHRRQGAGQSAGSVVALNLIGTCAATWGVVNANLGSQRERGQSWRATWGASVERSWGAITPHLEAFGTQHSAPTFQTGARWEWAPSRQLDATIGRQQGRTLLSVGFRWGSDPAPHRRMKKARRSGLFDGCAERYLVACSDIFQLSRAALAVSAKSLNTPSTPRL